MITRRVAIRAALTSTALVILAVPCLILAGAFLPSVPAIARFGAFLDVGLGALVLAVALSTALTGLAIALGGRRLTVAMLALCLLALGASGVAVVRYSSFANEVYATFDPFRALTPEPPIEAADAEFTFPSADPAVELHGQLWRLDPGSRAGYRSPRPAVVYVHGGGFVGGGLHMRPHLFRALALAGYPVLDIEYRLAPPPRWADAPADVLCGLAFLRTIAATEGIDPNRVVIMGESAGGSLALMAAYGAGTDLLRVSCPSDPIVPVGVIAVTPAADLAGIWEDGTLAGPDQHPIEDYTGGTPTNVPEHYVLGAPYRLIRSGLPPTILLAAQNDHLVRLARITPLAESLRAAGTDVRLMIVPFAEHGFDGLPNGIGAQLELSIVTAFLTEVRG